MKEFWAENGFPDQCGKLTLFCELDSKNLYKLYFLKSEIHDLGSKALEVFVG